MQEAFSAWYSMSVPFANTSEKLCTLNDCIWAMDVMRWLYSIIPSYINQVVLSLSFHLIFGFIGSYLI